MKYFDIFYIITYFLLKKLGRDEDAAKWSAMLHISTITALFTMTFIGTISVFTKPNLAVIMWNNIIYSMLGWCSFGCLFYLRYFIIKPNITSELRNRKISVNNFKKNIIKYLIFNIITIVSFVVVTIINKNVHGLS
jgi:hypothetical protein